MPAHDERDRKRSAAAWAARWWRALVAELISTALLVWLGLAAGVPVNGVKQPLSHVACAFGFVVVGNALAFGEVSGAHMNPAVTLAAALAGQLSWGVAGAYALAQCVGATLGFGGLMATMPESPGFGCTAPAPDVSPLAAAGIEAVLTFLLASACCAAWKARSPDPACAIKLGLLIAGLVYAGGPATGASLNPARSLGPALLQASWDHQWVYWVGPLGGAALAALLHRWVLTAPPAAAAASPSEDLTLADKP